MDKKDELIRRMELKMQLMELTVKDLCKMINELRNDHDTDIEE